ncbi:unnamed protein product [Calicophoron daubneyi]
MYFGDTQQPEQDDDYSSTGQLSPVRAEIERNMELRARKELEGFRLALYNQRNTYSVHTGPSSLDEPIPTRSLRSGVPAPTGVGMDGGLRSHISWQPITIGLVCSAFVVVVAVGAVTYYQKVHLPKKLANQGEGGEFSTRVVKTSPAGSLLGEATAITAEGDRKLAHSAQMYHYQHQKQQMLAVERASDQAQGSDEASESDVEEGDFTVYECPGLAAPGDLEVENPLYEGEAVCEKTPSPNGSSGELVGNSDLEDNSSSTPTAKTVEHS